MVQSSVLLLFLLFLSFLLLLHKLTGPRKGNLPPSPWKLPIIGNLHQLGKLPHRSLQALAHKYGPLVLLNLGSAPTLLVSSAETLREIIKTHDVAFSGRPILTIANIFLYGCTDVGFAPYGEYWRQAKKICVLELLSQKRVQSFEFVREEEVTAMVNSIRSVCLSGGAPLNITELLMVVTNNIVSKCVLGLKAEEKSPDINFGELSRKMMSQFGDFSFGDTFSYLGWIDHITGLIKQLKATFSVVDNFLDRIIEEHRRLMDDKGLVAKKDFVHILLQLQKDGMLEFQLTQDNIKAIIMGMFIGGTETSSTLLEWVMAELVRHQNVLRKAQSEVRKVVGQKSELELNDVNQMNYLKCIIKETLRLHPPAPLLIPRETISAVELAGYNIPPKTRVLINAFAIQRDPEIWDRPHEFFPERFENSCVDFRGHDFQLIPFGTGRRGCPGVAFASASAEFIIANLLYWFDWTLPDGRAPEDLDMNENYGLTVTKKFPLCLVPLPFSP